jgi:hypothetical protein
MHVDGVERRVSRRKQMSVIRTALMGIGFITLFGGVTLALHWVLAKFIPSDVATLISVGASLGAAVVLGMWATEAVVEMQNAHVHAHMRKVMEQTSFHMMHTD